MECDDAAVERQKLVSNDEEDDQNTITNVSSGQAKSVQTPISPVLSNKIFSSGDTSRSQNSTSFSIGKGNSDAAPTSTRLIYVNERKSQDKKGKTKKIQRDLTPNSGTSSSSHPKPPDSTTSTNNNLKTIQNKSSSHSSISKTYSFASRQLKHHSFISEVPDVRHMERALLGLLDDFHSGKLKAFGSGCTMEQMTSIREQQERLAKLHFDLGTEPFSSGNNDNEVQSQNNMKQLVQKLEQLSVSIEKLHSSNVEM